MNRLFGSAIYNRLKAATRSLIRSAGGCESAEQIGRLNKSQLSNCQNIATDQFLPIDAVIDLTKDTGDMVLIREMRRILLDVDEVSGITIEQISAAMMEAHKESAEAIQEAMQAMQDGKLDAAELRRIAKEADEAASAQLRLRDHANQKIQELQGA